MVQKKNNHGNFGNFEMKMDAVLRKIIEEIAFLGGKDTIKGTKTRCLHIEATKR